MAKRPKASPVSPAAVRLLTLQIAKHYGAIEVDATAAVELAQALIVRARSTRGGILRLTADDMKSPGFTLLRRIIVSEKVSENDKVRSALERCFLRPNGHEKRLRMTCDTACLTATLEISSWGV